MSEIDWTLAQVEAIDWVAGGPIEWLLRERRRLSILAAAVAPLAQERAEAMAACVVLAAEVSQLKARCKLLDDRWAKHLDIWHSGEGDDTGEPGDEPWDEMTGGV